MTEPAKIHSDSDQNELCWILVGKKQSSCWLARMVHQSEGNPTQVAFDYNWVIDREESRGDIVGFLHTHPRGARQPSQRDINTMRAWTSCLGKPLLCLIGTPNEQETRRAERDGDSGRPLPMKHVAAFRFDDDQSTGIPLGWVQVFDHCPETRFPEVDLVVVVETATGNAEQNRPGN